VLAGVSTDWYVRLEKGHITGVSDEVLDAVARRRHQLARARHHHHGANEPVRFLRQAVFPTAKSTTTITTISSVLVPF
jgi:hypothetical protein